MKYNPADFTYGVELEYADVLYGQPLPEGCTWNDKDNTIVNSNGVANDPKGILWKYGGEINTIPTYTVKEQVRIIDEINNMLNPKPTINYRCNLHIHVRVPNLKDDLEYVKKLYRYIRRYYPQAYDLIEQIPIPNPNIMTAEEYEGAKKRFKRRKRSHQYFLPEHRAEIMMNAKTTQEFFESHTHKDKNGNPAWFQTPREGINLRQMWESTNTIEFRHFPGTVNSEEMRSCLTWCREMLNAALNTGEPPSVLITNVNYKFPKFEPYDHKLELIYRQTNFDKNTREEVKQNLIKLGFING